KELEKSEVIRQYFDEWGSRCYLFTSELGRQYDPSKHQKKSITVEFDVHQIKTMGCDYLLSAVEIENSETMNMKLLDKFTTKDVSYSIYLYEII
ncbi:MAG: DUF6044 family protein, partial [Clostridiales bacterium]|nr:DUF6044 family protein [Clostridiales bacterium]